MYLFCQTDEMNNCEFPLSAEKSKPRLFVLTFMTSKASELSLFRLNHILSCY